MDLPQEDYTRWYIVQALFRLMGEYEYDKINVTEIAKKAGVGRATFYRYFKRKEDIIIHYFEYYKKEFIFKQHFYPRCKADYIEIVTSVLSFFKEQIQPFKLIRKARLEYIYLDYLNQNFAQTFESDYPMHSKFTPYLYAGMLFNVSMNWLDNDCTEPVSNLSQAIVEAIV